jgi:hypothetical protein
LRERCSVIQDSISGSSLSTVIHFPLAQVCEPYCIRDVGLYVLHLSMGSLCSLSPLPYDSWEHLWDVQNRVFGSVLCSNLAHKPDDVVSIVFEGCPLASHQKSDGVVINPVVIVRHIRRIGRMPIPVYSRCSLISSCFGPHFIENDTCYSENTEEVARKKCGFPHSEAWWRRVR